MSPAICTNFVSVPEHAYRVWGPSGANFMRVRRTLALLLFFIPSVLYAQQDQSLGDAARRLHAEKAEQAGRTAPPDWAVGPPQANHEPISMLALQPRNADGHKLLGLAYMMMRNVPSAMSEYQKAPLLTTCIT
jgi:hypothetical protein